MWYFTEAKDPEARQYDPASGRGSQPDHYPNVMRPGGGYPEGTGEESDTPCPTCKRNNLVDGSCPQCDWGSKNKSVPMTNYPLDPFADDKAGIRAGSFRIGREIKSEDAYLAEPDDWFYERDERTGRFWIEWPKKRTATGLLTKEELEPILMKLRRQEEEASGQMPLFQSSNWDGF
jgi:hypothetical protein